jgi:sugar lactone lactonase YvrE
VAGDGANASSGDGNAAASAGLQSPRGVAFDVVGNLFTADAVNARIRKVDANGIITTVAGGGSGGDGGAATNASLNQPSGLTLDTVGDLFIADYGTGHIRKVDTHGIITTVGGNLAPNGPTGLAIDAVGNLFVTDDNNNRVRKVNTNGIITTVAGNGNQTFSGDGHAQGQFMVAWASLEMAVRTPR